MRYPRARRDDVVDTLHGRQVPDPYRWLEDASHPDVEAWSKDQDALARTHLDGLPGRDGLRRRLLQLVPGVITPPVIRGEREFFVRRLPSQEHSTFCVREPDGAERVLIDPAVINPDLTTTYDGASPSKDGSRVAYLLSHGGNELSELRVLDVETGDDIDGPLFLGRGPGLAWSADRDELFYVGRVPEDRVPQGEEQLHRRVWRHTLGAARADDDLLFGEGRDKTTYYGISTSQDGRWLVVHAALGTAPRNDVYICDLRGDGAFAPVQEGDDVETFAGVAHDGRLYLLTNRDAPRRRLCVADPAMPTPSGWVDVLPQTDDVLTDYAVTTDAIVAVRTHDVVSQVTVHDRLTGATQHSLELPGLGMADVRGRPDGGDDVWIGYTDFVTPYQVLQHDLATGRTETWAEAPMDAAARIDAPIATRQVFYQSRDGTKIPTFLIERADGATDGHARPTLLYGYGGFNVSMDPAYSANIAAWVEHGGTYAIANLRGGSEYGEEWHRAGMRENKQNVFDDFIAAADWLVDGGTPREKLAIFGGSNGGLLVGATLTQRPDLCQAVVCGAPLLDMIRYELFGLGETWNDEYGRAGDPQEFEWVHSYSPYHHVVEGTRYPAVLFSVFEGDTRVDPLHARKMCAAIQHATASDPDDRPVLIRREKDVGHGSRAKTKAVDLSVDTLTFLANQLRLDLS